MRLLYPALTESVLKRLTEGVYRQVDLLEEHCPATAEHSRRVARYAVDLAIEFDRPLPLLETIGEAALLHDLGKCQIPLEILQKKEDLTDSEWLIMKRHVRLGFEMAECEKTAREMIPQHHEYRKDRSYPRSGWEQRRETGFFISGERRQWRERRSANPEKRFGGQVLAVSDALDALISNRFYKPEIDEGEAIQILHGEFSGDPRLLLSAAKRLEL